jgi:hypothetical protein
MYFRRGEAGYRGVRGEVIRSLQERLTAAGHDTRGLDGIYGQDTENALRSFQRARGLTLTGRVDDDTWLALMGTPSPALFDRCLQITGDFEGHGFGKAAGDFDGAGLTWGIIGFNFKSGTLGLVLGEVDQRSKAILDEAFGNLASELRSVLDMPRPRQIAWGRSISEGADRRRIRANWEAAFRRLGERPEAKEIQLAYTTRYWDRALADASRLGLKTELGMALCLDIAVQNGGIDTGRHDPRIRARLEAEGTVPERRVREIIAEVVAQRSSFPEIVLARKMALATGHGEVNYSRYAIPTWGLDDIPFAIV